MSDQLPCSTTRPPNGRPGARPNPSTSRWSTSSANGPSSSGSYVVIRTLCAAHVPLITASRVTDHAGGHRWDADAALLAAEAAGWLYRPSTKAGEFIPKR